jgi:O-antigen ligase
VTARLDWSRWLGTLLLALVAAPIGLLAGLEPAFAIVAALGAGFVVLAFTDLAAALAVFAFIGFVQVLPVDNLAKAAGLLLTLSWFALVTTRPRMELEFLTAHPYMSGALGAFIGWSLLSTTWATDTSTAIDSTVRYALNVVLFLIIFTAIRTPRELGWMMLAFVGGVAIATAHGIASPPDPALMGRLGSNTLDPNELAAVLVSGIALSVGVMVLYRRSPLIQLGAAMIAVFALVGVWLTVSRGGLIALAVAVVAAVLLAGRWRPMALIFACLLAFVTYAYFTAVASPEARARITSPTRGQTVIEEGRTTIWQVAWRAFEANPVEGVGAGNFQQASVHYLLRPGTLVRSDEIIGDKPKVVHNSYLEAAAELGAVGFLLFALIVGFSLLSMIRASRIYGRAENHTMQAVSLSIAVALIGNLAALFFISGEYERGLWLLLGLGPAILAMAKTAAAAGDQPGRLSA